MAAIFRSRHFVLPHVIQEVIMKNVVISYQHMNKGICWFWRQCWHNDFSDAVGDAEYWQWYNDDDEGTKTTVLVAPFIFNSLRPSEHRCVSKITPLVHIMLQIIWTNVGILLIRPFWTNFSEILIQIHMFSFKKMHLKISSGNWRPFRLGFNVFIYCT